MFSTIYTVILNSLTRQVARRPLGRWHASGDLNLKNHARDWSSADNCGICKSHNEPLVMKNRNEPLVMKNREMKKRIREIYIKSRERESKSRLRNLGK
jgi:hypothetical protein